MAKLIKRTDNGAIIEVFIPFGKSMMESEDLIQKSVNQIGVIATREALKNFDADGSPIEMGGVIFYSKDKVEKRYQTPYGPTILERYVYQSSMGGKTFCPLDTQARIITSSTPRFAKLLSYKYAANGAQAVAKDLEISNGRQVSKSFVQNVSESVGAIAISKEETWDYQTPDQEEPVKNIAIGLDGTCVHLSEEGFRQSMVGTIALYGLDGERIHTTYIGAVPEYGKETFLNRFEREIKNIKGKYPQGNYVGLADGAKDNWTFLEKHTTVQTIDFYHVSEYLGEVAEALGKDEKDEWLSTTLHDLKHKQGAANRIYRELMDMEKLKLPPDNNKKIKNAVTYFENNRDKMKYSKNVKENLPIGSGVTEAACKVIVKQRLCCSGMKWKDIGAGIVLSLRCMVKTEGRWEQFWQKIDKYGVPISC